jgi:hypothetical protein
MAQDVYGDSFGDLSRNVQSQAAARQAALARSLDTAVQSLSAARAHATELQRMNQQDRQFGEELQFRKDQEATRKDESDRNYKLAQAQAGLSEKYEKAYEQSLEVKKDQLTPAKQREHDMMFQQATDDAAQGTFDDVDHVKKLYPDLSPAEQNVIFERNQQARQQIVADHVTAENSANVLNTNNAIRQRIYQIGAVDMPAAKKNRSLFSWGPSEQENALTQEQQKLQAQLQQISPIAEQLTKDKAVNNLVTFDPKTEKFVSNLSAPRWMTSPTEPAPEEDPNEGIPDEQPTVGTSSAPSARTMQAPSATSTATSGASEPIVRMRTRDGRVWQVPQSKVQEAVKRGATPVQQGSMISPQAADAMSMMVN